MEFRKNPFRDEIFIENQNKQTQALLGAVYVIMVLVLRWRICDWRI